MGLVFHFDLSFPPTYSLSLIFWLLFPPSQRSGLSLLSYMYAHVMTIGEDYSMLQSPVYSILCFIMYSNIIVVVFTLVFTGRIHLWAFFYKQSTLVHFVLPLVLIFFFLVLSRFAVSTSTHSALLLLSKTTLDSDIAYIVSIQYNTCIHTYIHYAPKYHPFLLRQFPKVKGSAATAGRVCYHLPIQVTKRK